MRKKVKEIAALVGGELVGDGEAVISSINGIKEAGEGELSFVVDSRYESLIDGSKASCVIAPKNIRSSHNKPVIKVENPSVTLSRIREFAMPQMVPHPNSESLP